MQEEFISESEEQTLEFAAKLAAKLERPAVICLEGNLGAGKSVFARGFLRGLDWKDTVSSPTFSLINTYYTESGPVFHMDLYRLEDDEQARSTGIEDALNDYEGICLIEWAERLKWMLPADSLHLKIEHLNETSRKLTLS